MQLKSIFTLGFILAACSSLTGLTAAQSISFGSATGFAVLGSSSVSSTGLTVVDGNLGVSPGTAVTGFGPGIVNGAIHAGNSAALSAQADAITAYGVLSGLVKTQDLTGIDLGGKTLQPGVYHFDTIAQLTGALTLDSLGQNNARFVFQIGTALVSAANSAVLSINGTHAQIYWQVGSSATLGTETAFLGSIIADQSITLNSGSSIRNGRALALHAAVTLDNNHVAVESVPEPATFGAMALGVGLLVRRRRISA